MEGECVALSSALHKVIVNMNLLEEVQSCSLSKLYQQLSVTFLRITIDGYQSQKFTLKPSISQFIFIISDPMWPTTVSLSSIQVKGILANIFTNQLPHVQFEYLSN